MGAQTEIVTLGCRLNTLESEVVREQALAAGLRDTVIINTCAVTAEAERQARQSIRRIRRERPTAQIIVTGCAAQIDPDRFAAMPEVDRVVGNKEKLDSTHLAEGNKKVDVSHMAQAGETPPPLMGGFKERTRAFLQVQQGCDHSCTFCVVPQARGPSRSFEPDHIIQQARRLTENGHSEVVLTGVDVSSYGDEKSGHLRLSQLVRLILDNVEDVKRLRLTSLDPALDDPELFRLLAEEPRFMPHLHLSLQSGDDTVLKRMKRRHNRDGAQNFCHKARQARSDVVFGADLIAGFPTESEEMFANTLSLLDDLQITYLHAFPYSPRPGTPAAHMPQVANPLRKERAAALRAAGAKALNDYLNSRIGETVEVLVEKNNTGHCRHFAPVRLDFDAAPGAIVNARIKGVEDGRLIGHLVS